MLTLTENASHAVHDLTERAGLPAEGGMRIAESSQQGTFDLSLVTAPVEGDELIEAEGARVFVEPTTATMLSDQQLDVAPAEGGTGFMLAPQG
ncbi:adhesin [Isoptericola sp. b441]|uniref:Adhesin n=1 Tax=Actinotalea lenta TaxID=3064654 RepID=A0ABT9D546_9CELL|nr:MULTISPECIES: adhesin [unclassified Isoptericola]MDO8105872.1 adhesin [Isoptericola sp. b441]MDO8122588.1 adhesin [Isoptericola sp. b490]